MAATVADRLTEIQERLSVIDTELDGILGEDDSKILSEDELRDYIVKLQAFEAGGLGEALFLADDPDVAGDFTNDSETVRGLLPDGTTSHSVYLSAMTPPDARTALFDFLDQGTIGFTNYIGHGALDRFADEGLLLTTDIDTLTNAVPPIIASLTYTVGRYEIPGWASLAESLVTHAGGGAVATWSPSGLSYNDQAMILNEALIEAMYADDTRYLGDAVQSALEEFAENGELPFMLSIYNLLGDPATTLR